jgi:hypothetical protein
MAYIECALADAFDRRCNEVVWLGERSRGEVTPATDEWDDQPDYVQGLWVDCDGFSHDSSTHEPA